MGRISAYVSIRKRHYQELLDARFELGQLKSQCSLGFTYNERGNDLLRNIQKLVEALSCYQDVTVFTDSKSLQPVLVAKNALDTFFKAYPSDTLWAAAKYPQDSETYKAAGAENIPLTKDTSNGT